MQLPRISGYGKYSSENYGLNCLRVELGNLILYFSYDTVIAFKDGCRAHLLRQNDWSTTTGKHLNWIDGGSKEAKARRLSGEEFERELTKALVARGLLSD